MRRFFGLIAALAFAVSANVGAQPSDEKEPVEAKKAAEPTQTKTNASDDKTKSSDDKTATGDKATKKNAKKAPPAPAPVDEAELLKTLCYMQGFGQGHEIFKQYKQQGIELDEEILVQAFRDGLSGKDPSMTEDEMRKALPQIQSYLNEKYTAIARERAAVMKAEGEAFLAENKKKEGIKTLQSGLQYKVLKSGKGETPKKTDTVKVHYKGTLMDGSEFDNSYKKGSPLTLQVSRFIPGWGEAMQLMKVGDKWQLFIPPELGYKEAGVQDQGRQVIPPNATLVFEVELLGIEKGGKTSLPATLK
jgi:FKBP-type peptidyl-prolyl cis-trans isomerase